MVGKRKSGAERLVAGVLAVVAAAVLPPTASGMNPKECANSTNSLANCLECCGLILWNDPEDYNRCIIYCYREHDT